MKLFGTIGSVITSLKEEQHTLMVFIPSKTVNRFDHSEQLLEMKKPTVACRLSSSVIFRQHTFYSRLTTNQHPRDLRLRAESRSKSKELLYD